ncbi:MAG: serine/threonine protein kinase [Gemmataceae bacterium]|nr:serine/threonine protein kinase [Gemmataceae bacterium]
MSAAPPDPLAPFLATLRKSRLVDPAELDRLAARANADAARAFADQLIRSGHLTHYQADKLLRGLWQGLVLGPYSVLAPIGRGGMGTVVYLARDRRMSEELGDVELVALKLLPDRKAARDPRILARFRREMDLGRQVEHRNVVRTLGSGEIDAVHFLAMEFVPGKTLRQVVAENGPLDVGAAARVFADVAAGLAHVHARGLVHRDVKPANVMLRPDGRAVLLDLGLAIRTGEELPDDLTIVGGPGYAVGTMDYLAPEQARDASAVGPPADLYALGGSLVFALTGSVPFPAATTKEKVLRHRDDPPPPLPGVPPAFERMVHKLLAKTPAGRFASAAEMRDRLLPFATAMPVRPAVDVLALADVPGRDSGLWDSTPGEEIPVLEEVEVEEIVIATEIIDEEPPARSRRGCAAVFVLAGVAVAVGRWL